MGFIEKRDGRYRAHYRRPARTAAVRDLHPQGEAGRNPDLRGSDSRRVTGVWDGRELDMETSATGH